MEIATIFHKEYEVKEKPDGTIILKPIIHVTDRRAALKEYTTQELVDEVWERCEEDLKKERREKELWKNIILDSQEEL